MLDTSEKLFGFKVTHVHWPAVKEMANRKQSFNSICTTVDVRCIKNIVDKFLKREVRYNEDSALPKKIMCCANAVS